MAPRSLTADRPAKTPELLDRSSPNFYNTIVARSSRINLLKSELRHTTPFRNGKATNEGESADFANFDPKIGCHGKVP